MQLNLFFEDKLLDAKKNSDDLITQGDVHIIRNNQPQYIVLSQERYQELLEAQEEAYEARVRASLEDLKVGRVKRGTAEDLIRELNLEN